VALRSVVSQQKPRARPDRGPAKGGAASRPRRRAWLRLALAVGLSLVFFLSAEGILRLAGVGYSPCFLGKRVIEGRACWTDNPDFGRRFFPRGLVRYPRPFTMPVAKGPNTVRIFVLGESAAMGDPDPKFGLPRMLEVLMRERFPDRQVEVINAAMVAINSHVVLPIARDCAQGRGDLWVVYMGNNEMIGPFGSVSVFGARAPPLPLVRAGLWVKATRLGQLLDGVAASVSQANRPLPEWTGMAMMADLKVRPDAPASRRVYRHFERNLADLLATGAGAGVPVLLCTVASNLKDCAPFASLHRPGLAAAQLAQWQAAYDAGVAWQEQAKPAEAMAAYERAAAIDGEFADLCFRRAECCLRLGRDAEAATLFGLARDNDALQFRADARINGVIRRAAAGFDGRRAALLDAEALFATNSQHGVPGGEFFYEHVHLTPEGNYLLARAVAEQAARLLSLGQAGQWRSQADCLRALGLTDRNRYEMLDVMRERVEGPPFTGQIGHVRELDRLQDQLARYRLGSKPAQARRDLQQLTDLVAHHPEDPDLRWNLAVLLENAGDAPAAERQWRALIALEPQAALPRINLAKLLDGHNRQAEAFALYREGLRINPEYYPARPALGLLCLRMGFLQEGIRHLDLAVRQRPRSIETRLALGQALARAQRSADAEKQAREILRLDPGNAPAQALLDTLRAGR
jgi:tetratricopeptide (TPR) repeat protein